MAKLNNNDHRLWSARSVFVLAGLLLPFSMRKRLKLSRAAALCLLFLALCGAGCGGGTTYGSNVAAAGSFTVNVTAARTGGPASKAVGLTVTIVR